MYAKGLINAIKWDQSGKEGNEGDKNRTGWFTFLFMQNFWNIITFLLHHTRPHVCSYIEHVVCWKHSIRYVDNSMQIKFYCIQNMCTIINRSFDLRDGMLEQATRRHNNSGQRERGRERKMYTTVKSLMNALILIPFDFMISASIILIYFLEIKLIVSPAVFAKRNEYDN